MPSQQAKKEKIGLSVGAIFFFFFFATLLQVTFPKAFKLPLFVPGYFRLLRSLYYPVLFLPCGLWDLIRNVYS